MNSIYYIIFKFFIIQKLYYIIKNLLYNNNNIKYLYISYFTFIIINEYVNIICNLHNNIKKLDNFLNKLRYIIQMLFTIIITIFYILDKDIILFSEFDYIIFIVNIIFGYVYICTLIYYYLNKFIQHLHSKESIF